MDIYGNNHKSTLEQKLFSVAFVFVVLKYIFIVGIVLYFIINITWKALNELWQISDVYDYISFAVASSFLFILLYRAS